VFGLSVPLSAGMPFDSFAEDRGKVYLLMPLMDGPLLKLLDIPLNKEGNQNDFCLLLQCYSHFST